MAQMANLQLQAAQAASDHLKTSGAVALAWRLPQIQQEAPRVGHMAAQPGALRVARQHQALVVVVGQATSSALWPAHPVHQACLAQVAQAVAHLVRPVAVPRLPGWTSSPATHRRRRDPIRPFDS
jgi:hypothetical protein